MNNLEKLLQDSKEKGCAEKDLLFVMSRGDCPNCPALSFCKSEKGKAAKGCAETRARWLLQEYVDPDSWEKIEADAKLLSCEYWKCCGMSCYECPAYFNGFIKPKEFYGVGSCDKAKACDLVARAKKLAGVEE